MAEFDDLIAEACPMCGRRPNGRLRENLARQRKEVDVLPHDPGPRPCRACGGVHDDRAVLRRLNRVRAVRLPDGRPISNAMADAVIAALRASKPVPGGETPEP